jgi:hypothetical protein
MHTSSAGRSNWQACGRYLCPFQLLLLLQLLQAAAGPPSHSPLAAAELQSHAGSVSNGWAGGGGGGRGAVSIQPLSHTEDLQTLSDSSGRISISACACTREHIAWMCMSPIDKHLTAARCCISSLTSSSQSSCNSSPRRASHEAHSPFSHDAPGALRTSGTTAAS